MEGVTILDAAQLEECAKLYVAVFNSEPWNDNWTVHTAHERLQDIYLSPKFYGLIYRKQDKIQAVLLGNCEQWFEGLHFNLKEMYVSPEMQGMGIGGKLITYLEHEIKQMGVKTILLFTSKGNSTSDFYEKQKYEELQEMAMMAKELP